METKFLVTVSWLLFWEIVFFFFSFFLFSFCLDDVKMLRCGNESSEKLLVRTWYDDQRKETMEIIKRPLRRSTADVAHRQSWTFAQLTVWPTTARPISPTQWVVLFSYSCSSTISFAHECRRRRTTDEESKSQVDDSLCLCCGVLVRGRHTELLIYLNIRGQMGLKERGGGFMMKVVFFSLSLCESVFLHVCSFFFREEKYIKEEGEGFIHSVKVM